MISSIWDVYQKPSTGEDHRYSVLGDEIDKHYFMNDDWTRDKLYLSVLHILDDDERLQRFVEGMVNVAQLGEGNDTIKEINQVLEEDGLIISRNGSNIKKEFRISRVQIPQQVLLILFK